MTIAIDDTHGGCFGIEIDTLKKETTTAKGLTFWRLFYSWPPRTLCRRRPSHFLLLLKQWKLSFKKKSNKKRVLLFLAKWKQILYSRIDESRFKWCVRCEFYYKYLFFSQLPYFATKNTFSLNFVSFRCIFILTIHLDKKMRIAEHCQTRLEIALSLKLEWWSYRLENRKFKLFQI